MDELSSVSQDLEAMGAEAAEVGLESSSRLDWEARVRQILCGLGFSISMMDGPVSVLPGAQG